MQGDASEEKPEIATERITRQPQVVETKLRVKDPRRVAAGKALGESNKRAREALKREIEVLAQRRGRKPLARKPCERRVLGSDESLHIRRRRGLGYPLWFFKTVISIVGIGITIFPNVQSRKV